MPGPAMMAPATSALPAFMTPPLAMGAPAPAPNPAAAGYPVATSVVPSPAPASSNTMPSNSLPLNASPASAQPATAIAEPAAELDFELNPVFDVPAFLRRQEG